MQKNRGINGTMCWIKIPSWQMHSAPSVPPNVFSLAKTSPLFTMALLMTNPGNPAGVSRKHLSEAVTECFPEKM
ncbi:MAG: hypothetical protein WDO19_18950 [Bacteroidota bacterium]